jgi:hypothetical protein
VQQQQLQQRRAVRPPSADGGGVAGAVSDTRPRRQHRLRPGDSRDDSGPRRFISRLSRSRSEPRVRNGSRAVVAGASAPAVLRPQPASEPAEAPLPRQALTDPAKDDCSICMEALRDSCARCAVAGRRGRCGLATGQCGHTFHACCIGDWVVSCGRQRRTAKCPVDNVIWRFQRDVSPLAAGPLASTAHPTRGRRM